MTGILIRAALRRSASVAALSALFLGAMLSERAIAQTAGNPGTPASGDPAPATAPGSAGDAGSAADSVQEIVVTGTNISGVKPVGSEAISLDRTQMLATGQTNIFDVLQTVPQIQTQPNGGAGGQVMRQGGTASYGSAAGGGSNVTQGTAINIRGLGTSATLTLVDGRRVAPSGSAAAFTEATQVPLAALERVEVVTDGNSAVYGSDAIAGVVNFVLRKNFDGLELSARDTYSRYYNQWGASATAGHTWNELGRLGAGNVILTFDYGHRGAMIEGQSKFLRQDLRPLGGKDLRVNNATVSAAAPILIVGGNGVPYTYYAIPAGSGAGTSFASLGSPKTADQLPLVDASDYTDFLGRQTRIQVAGFANQDLTSGVSAYLEGFYTHRSTRTRAWTNSLIGNNVSVCQGSPYFISGAPAAALSNQAGACHGGPAETIAVNPLTFLGGQTVTSNPDTTYTVTGGLKVQLPLRWKLDTYFTYGHDQTCGICNYGNNANYAAAAGQFDTGAINPLSGAPTTDAQRATFLGDNLQFARNIFHDAVAKFDGPLFQLPGGMVRAAFGGEYSYNQQHLLNRDNTNTTATSQRPDPRDNRVLVSNVTTTHRHEESVFGELYVPLVGPDNATPLITALNLDAAFRYDHYSDFGSTTNPKFSGTLTLFNDLSLRGSWGTSFRAPALTDTNPENFSVQLIGLPIANNSGNAALNGFIPGNAIAYQVIGANPVLKPETATNWSAGFDFRPHGVPGLKLSATYFNTHYNNQIGGPNTGLFLSSPANAALYSNYIIPVHNNLATCVNGNPSTYDPVLRDFIAQAHPLYTANIIPACFTTVIIDGRITNAASTFQDGLDFQLNYVLNSSVGTWNLGGSLTKLLHQELTPVKGGTTAKVLDTFYYPVSLRGRGQVGWTKDGLGAQLFANYVGSYTNTIPYPAGSPSSRVHPWLTFDLSLSYQIGKDDAPSLLRGLRASLQIINIADRDPPRVLTQAGNSYAAYDANNANIYGRYVTFSLTKAF